MKPTHDPSLIAEVEHETWERCAEGYVDGFGALVSESITPLLDAACVVAHGRVLDVGTGPGRVAAAVRDRQARAIGIDFLGINGGRGTTAKPGFWTLGAGPWTRPWLL